jgi:PQQ-dependent dehydrogenase (methanol/ethanol family)
MKDAPVEFEVLPFPGRRRRVHQRPSHSCPAALLILLVAAVGFGPACRRDPTPSGATVPSAAAAPASPSLPSAIPFPEADESSWIRPARDYASSRYSTLSQINRDNVGKLQVAFTFSTGVNKGHEAAPLVIGNTMYVITPYPNYLHALDLTKPGSPEKWVYKPKTLPSAQGVACCDVVNRGAVYDRGRIYFNTLDDQTVAVDAETGKEVWTTKVGEINHGESMTMAPLVVKGKVLVGNSGGEFGVRGWLTALDEDTGKLAWRAWSTGPDKDVLIGPRFKPFYASDRGTDLGMTTWPGDLWKIGGGTVWGWISYDPQLNLVYYGTSNPGPWNADQRPGDNKWTAAVIARDPDDGQAVWAYQFSPHDLYDYDGVNENVVLDLPIGGQTRKTLLRADRDGFFYVIDRTTGEVLSAQPFAYVTTRTGVDLKTGRPNEVEALKPQVGKTVRGICPAAPGGKDWQPMAFSPRTGVGYIAHNHLCQDEEGLQANYIEGTPYVGANVKMYAGPGGHRGEFTAWDPIAAKPVWKIKEKFPAWSGALATAGDVVFYGTMEGWFQAVDARTGNLLWKFKCGSGIIGQPITYRGPDGRQYVAILSGVGGWSGAIVSNNLDPRDGTAALGFVNAMGDLPAATTAGGMLYVFALP